jgi:WD40 repeat protein
MSRACIATLGGDLTIISIIFSPDGKHLVSNSGDVVQLWDGISGASIPLLECYHTNWVPLLFSPNSLRLATTPKDSNIQLWDTISGTPIATLESHSEYIQHIKFSPSSLQLASLSEHTVQLWDGMSGVPIAKLQVLHPKSFQSLAFSQDGLRLAVASNDTVQLYDAMSGTNIAMLTHSEPVQSISFFPDGLWLASHSNNTIHLWDAMSGMPIAMSETLSRPVMCAADLAESTCWYKEQWMTLRDPLQGCITHICYIPPLYSPSMTIIKQVAAHQLLTTQMVIGCYDGCVIILGIPDHRLFAD